MRGANSPTQPLIDQNGVVNVPQQHQTPIIQVSENLNSNSGGAVSKKRSRQQKGKRMNWTKSEDSELKILVFNHGEKAWATIARSMDQRNSRQCRDRWLNHLCPSILKNKIWSDEEERKLAEGHQKFGGNKWTKIAQSIPGKSGTDVKNHWNRTMKWVKNNPSTFLENHIREKLINDENNSLSTQPPIPEPMDNTITPIEPFSPPPPFTGDNAQLPLYIEDYGTVMPSFTSQTVEEEIYSLWAWDSASFQI